MRSISWRLLLLHLSSVRLRTFETCVPSDRWMPLHSMQIMMHRFSDAQSATSAPQSAHWTFTYERAASVKIHTALPKGQNCER